MKRSRGLIAGGAVLLVLASACGALAAGIEDFKLSKAIPADAMLVVHARDHAGMKFVSEQYARVWAAVEKQHFDRDLKRLLQAGIEQDGGDAETFESWWQQLSDLLAGVEWSSLAKDEFAFALKLAPPTGAEFIVLLRPAQERTGEDFKALGALLEALAKLDEQGNLQLAHEGEGDSVVHRLSVANMPVGLGLVLARHQDVILFGLGSSMPDQALALLRGESDAAVATLASTARFKEALKPLGPPVDSVFFVDLAQIMSKSKVFAQMLAAMAMPGGAESPASQPASPAAALVPLVDALDMWDYAAEVTATDGMKCTGESVTALRADAKNKPLAKVFYGGKPIQEPLKYVPKEATEVNVGAGIDWQALYQAALDFVRKEVPEGEAMLAQWDAARQTMPFDIEEHLLSWLGGRYVTFSAPIPTPFMPGWVMVLEVRDEQKATAALDLLTELLNGMLAEQGAGVEDAKIEGAEGFRRVILPPFLAMMPGLGRPVFGLKDGRLFLANGPEVLTAALEVAAGQRESFAKNERYMAEGLPLDSAATGFAFTDLTNWGQTASQMLSAVALGARMAQGQAAKDPAVNTALLMLTKVGNVLQKFDFYRSRCTITTFDGTIERTRTVVHYQEPPKPKGRSVEPEEPTTQPSPAAGG